MADCSNDGSFGPTVLGCRGNFDFTLTFENIFMSVVPSAIFTLAAIIRLMCLRGRNNVVSGHRLQMSKVVAITMLATVQLALLLLQTTQPSSDTINEHQRVGLSLASTSMMLVVCLFMLPLSYIEHVRTVRPSMVISFYLLVTLLLDVAQLRTAWLVAGPFFSSLLARLQTCSFSIKLLLLLLETASKARWTHWDLQEHSPEETSGLIGLSLYAWLNRLFLRGYSKVLAIDDLYPLDPALQCRGLHRRFAEAMKTTHFKGKAFGVPLLLFKTMPSAFLLPIIPELILVALTYCQPFFMTAMLKYLIFNSVAPDTFEGSSAMGYGLIGAAALIYLGIAIFTAIAHYLTSRCVYMIRACLSIAIYSKTASSQSSALEHAAPVTLMSSDLERITTAASLIHVLWVSLIEGAVGSWLLYNQLGGAFAAPIVTIIVSALAVAVLAVPVATRQRTWLMQIEKRVGLTSSVIATMKSSKISGITEPIAAVVRRMRVSEISAGSRWRALLVVVVTISMCPPNLVPVFAFAVAGKSLNATTIYTSMTFMLLLTSPLTQLMQIVAPLQTAMACLVRVREFLEREDHVDFRNSTQAIPLLNKASTDQLLTYPCHWNQEIPLHSMSNRFPEDEEVAMSISCGFFGWTPETHVLKDINVLIPRGKLTIVVGPVASGKSTLCKVLLGEVPCASGDVRVRSRRGCIGFCNQTPFLLNASLKQNIIGFSPFDQPKYDAVIQATMLAQDILRLPSGDGKNIGSNGIMLSGGQKQRVSLARALYLDSDVMIFDDVLGGLDNDTETEVVTRVFSSEGLIKTRGATALLCTHSIRHLHIADHIIALGSDGRVIEQGSFSELMRENRYIASLGLKVWDSDTETIAPETPTHDVDIGLQSAVGSETDHLEAELDRARQLGDFSVYAEYFRNTGVLNVVLFAVTSVVYGFTGSFSTVWLGFWTENKYGYSHSVYLGVFGLLRGVQTLSIAVGFYFTIIRMVRSSGTKLHNGILNSIMQAPLSFFTKTDTGVVTNLFSQDLGLVDLELPTSLAHLGANLTTAIATAFVIALASPYLAISYPVLVLVLWVLQKFYLRTSRQLRMLDLEAKSPLYSHFLDTIHGIVTIRAFGWSKANLDQNYNLVDRSQRPAYLLVMIQQWLMLVLNIIVAFMAIMLVTLATQLNASVGFAGASFISLISFGTTLADLISMYTMVETSIGAVARLRTFRQTVESEGKSDEDIVPPESWPETGRIVMRNVSASYDTDSAQFDPSASRFTLNPKPKLALDDVSLIITAGSKVAICGRTGSGKSSLVLLLLKLLNTTPMPGSNILIDDVPLANIDRSTLRKRIIAVPQDPVFLPSGCSIKQNLDPFDRASPALCLSALSTVKLGKFVDERGGLDAAMDSDMLSAGQKQLFSLARAVVRRQVRDDVLQQEGQRCRGGLLLLDEVSSGVDNETEREMQEVIQREFGAYTVLMVAHRLDMVVKYAEEVVVMDKGAVLEQGRPNELLGKENSRFRELWKLGNVGREGKG
ncbi:hypothetical protein TD95_005155, partial [Thielaviopsis punctulata]